MLKFRRIPGWLEYPRPEIVDDFPMTVPAMLGDDEDNEEVVFWKLAPQVYYIHACEKIGDRCGSVIMKVEDAGDYWKMTPYKGIHMPFLFGWCYTNLSHVKIGNWA